MQDERFRKLPPSSKPVAGCPFCGCAQVDEGALENESGGMFIRFDSCPRCDGTWRHEFAFKEWAVVLHPETLAEPAAAPAPSEPAKVLRFKGRP